MVIMAPSRNPIEFGHDDGELRQFDVPTARIEEKVRSGHDDRIETWILKP